MYQESRLTGGHIIMLGPNCEDAALSACKEYPGGLQVGGLHLIVDKTSQYIIID